MNKNDPGDAIQSIQSKSRKTEEDQIIPYSTRNPHTRLTI